MTSHVKEFTAAETESADQFSHHSIVTQPSRPYRDRFKRLIDIALVILMTPIAVPLVAIFALIIVTTGGTPFFWQRRIGKDGAIFEMLKIRTMVPNAKEKLEAHLAADTDARAEWNSTQKLKDDPRITPIGKFLRRSSLDELPQLWNVLRGDMSIVGPRPMMEDQKPLYPGKTYYSMRPGITGSWQVSDRNETTFAARARFDKNYYDSLTLKTDLSILVRTVGVVLRCSGY
ncbi:sugar transferase [Ruegeria atlantica]